MIIQLPLWSRKIPHEPPLCEEELKDPSILSLMKGLWGWMPIDVKIYWECSGERILGSQIDKFSCHAQYIMQGRRLRRIFFPFITIFPKSPASKSKDSTPRNV